MSIIQKELKAQIKQKKRELAHSWDKLSNLLKSKEAAEVAKFVDLMKVEPEIGDFISSDLAEAQGITAKKLRKKGRIEFQTAHLVWENFHANGIFSDDSLTQVTAAIDMAKDEISKRQGELKDAEMQLTAQKINEKLSETYDYEQVVVPVIEGLVPKMIARYSRLAKSFDRTIELINEGGAVAAIGEEEMKQFLFDYENFSQDIISLQLIIYNSKQSQWFALRSGKLSVILGQFKKLKAACYKLLKELRDDAVKYSSIDFMLQDLYGEACPTSIFNLLVDDTKVEMFIDGRFKEVETVKQNLLDRIKLCWKAGVDCFFDEGAIEGAKVDAIKGLKKSVIETVDVAFDKVVYESLKEKVAKADLTSSMEILEIASRAKIAGNVYQPIPTLKFAEGVADPFIDQSYGVRSIVGKLAPNLLLKVDKEGDVPGMEWVGNSTAEYMNYALLMSAGGGRVFMNKAALIAFAAISNSLVDVKAYIASVAGSSCVEEKSVMSAIGTVVWVYVDENGKPIIRNGRIRGKKNSNEGSSWNNWGGNLSFQERTIAEAWCSYLEKVNETQAHFSLNFQRFVNGLKEQIRMSSFFAATWKQPKVDYENKLKDIRGLVFIPEDKAQSLKDPNKNYALTNLKVHTGKTGVKFLKLPMIIDLPTTEAFLKAHPAFEFKGSIGETVSASIKHAKHGIDVYFGTYRTIMRNYSQDKTFDWTEYFTNGSDPLVKDYLAAYKCEWDWSKSATKRNLDNAFKAQVDGFATFKTKAGRTIVDIRREMEDAVEWPVFQGIETLWGFEPKLSEAVKEEIQFVLDCKKLSAKDWAAGKADLLSKFPSLVAKRLEQAVEIDGFDPTVWSNTLATAIIGKGKSLPVDLHKLFTPWNDGICADNLRGDITDEAKWATVSFVKNKDDGACKSKDYKSFLKKVGEVELASKFDLDDEKSAEPGQAMVPVGYMFGEPMKVRVAIMRRMKLGKVGATFQATEKKPTRLSEAGTAGAATEKSTIAYKEYMGILPCGGTMSRTELPQIPARLREDFLDSLKVDYEDVVANPTDLQPLQEFVSEANSSSTKSVLISLDGFIIDGHHRWYANKDNESITCTIVHMLKDELLEKAKAFEGSFVAEPTRFELVKQFFDLVSMIDMKTKSGNALTSFQSDLDPYDTELPAKVYLNMMEALCRIESEELFDKVKDGIARSLDGDLLKTLKAMGVEYNSSAKLSNKMLDSINSKLADFARGAVIKAVNIPVHVFDAIEQGTIILPPSN
jgi:hypothetical protein